MGIEDLQEGKRVHLQKIPLLNGEEEGNSLNISGACLTIEEIKDDSIVVYLSPETLQKTWFDNLEENNVLNIELPLTPNDKMGGHYVQGHVDCFTEIKNIEKEGSSFKFDFKKPENTDYIVEKGFISVEGISLTINKVEESVFSIMVIPKTWEKTNLSELDEGDEVNLEYDIMAKYAENNYSEKEK
ncbi:MAG: riboflavin synthase [Candidatus Nanohaloarchaea archaeon]